MFTSFGTPPASRPLKVYHRASGSEVTPAISEVLHIGIVGALSHLDFLAILYPNFDKAQFPYPLLPPDTQRQSLRFLIRIHAMPFVGGQSLPRRLLSCPAHCSFAPVRSPIGHGA